jgi:predicted Fe-Mo cluster-binding NifX family protein
MTTQTFCVPVTPDGEIADGWGRTRTMALATVADGRVVSWTTVDVAWDASHDSGTEGSHHARVVRFVQDNRVTVAVAHHMGQPMQNMLTKLGVDVRLGAAGDARTAVLSG